MGVTEQTSHFASRLQDGEDGNGQKRARPHHVVWFRRGARCFHKTNMKLTGAPTVGRKCRKPKPSIFTQKSKTRGRRRKGNSNVWISLFPPSLFPNPRAIHGSSSPNFRHPQFHMSPLRCLLPHCVLGQTKITNSGLQFASATSSRPPVAGFVFL